MLKISQFASITGIPATALRYYDEIGLLKPAYSDPTNGYRGYGYEQLQEANRFLALRDLGFSLEEIRDIMTRKLSPSKVRQMLRNQHKVIQRQVHEAYQRLLVMENTLREVEMEGRLSNTSVRIKTVEAVRVLSQRVFAPDVESIDAVIEATRRQLESHAIEITGALRLIFYDLVYPETHIDVEVAIPTPSKVTPIPPAHIRTLPEYPVVAAVYQNGRAGIARAWSELYRWIRTNGYAIDGPFQEVLLLDTPKQTVFELFFPIKKHSEGIGS